MIATEYAVWFFPLAFVGLAAMVLASYVVTSEAGDIGLTTEITSLLVFICGALVYWGYLELGAALAVIVTLFLSLKVKLHGLCLTAPLHPAHLRGRPCGGGRHRFLVGGLR